MVAMPETAPAQKLDDETTAALTLLNEYVNADREATRHKREIAKAEKAKDQAAAAVRKLEKDGGSGEEKATAETAYRDSVAALKAIREGKKPEAAAKAEEPKEAETKPTEPDAPESTDSAPETRTDADDSAPEAPAETAETESSDTP